MERWIYVGNNARILVKGIDTCKLVLRGGQTLLLHDILYAPNIRRNLIYVLVLLKFGFNWYFYDDNVRLCLGTTFYGSGFVLDGLIVMDVNYVDFNNDASFSLITSANDYEVGRRHYCRLKIGAGETLGMQPSKTTHATTPMIPVVWLAIDQ